MKYQTLITIVLLAASCGLLSSCKEKPKTLGEKIDDALDARSNEKLKDAAEDLQDAARDAKKGIKDAAKDVKEAVKDATKKDTSKKGTTK